MLLARSCTVAVGIALAAAAAGLAWAAEDGAAKPALPNPIFVFQDGLTGVPPQKQAAMLKELGYDGSDFEGPLPRLPETLKALDAQGLKLFAVYTGANVDADKPPYDPGLKTALAQLKGRNALLWMTVLGGKPSSSDADERAVAICREVADMAEQSGLRVALYPHVGMYVSRVDDAVRLAKKVDRKNFGASFNLCHFLKLDDEKQLEQRLKETMPYLFAVSINGADGGRTNELDWNRLIQTLDRGNLDVGRVLGTLKRGGYTGPIGLQCYAIPGDPRENLARSMAAWRKLSARIAAEP